MKVFNTFGEIKKSDKYLLWSYPVTHRQNSTKIRICRRSRVLKLSPNRLTCVVTFFKTFLIAKQSNNVYSPMASNVLIQFGRQRMKTVVGVMFWNSLSHVVLCYEKRQSRALKNCDYWHSVKKVITCIPHWLIEILFHKVFHKVFS